MMRRQSTFVFHHTSHPWSKNKILIWMVRFHLVVDYISSCILASKHLIIMTLEVFFLTHPYCRLQDLYFAWLLFLRQSKC